jgi:hypothetical protein
MRLAEEQKWLNSLQEEAALWLREFELADAKSATALVQSSKDQWIGKLLTCATPIHSRKIYCYNHPALQLVRMS